MSTSPWEGAAGVATNGDLPSSGFFIATNSFPRNTMVDITNIETGKSTRAIVANTLNNPGLLAVVSREAAELIGMRTGSISRIRLLSPSDPIAYQRFTEGLALDIPPFDSGVLRTEPELMTEVYGMDTFVPTVQVTEIPPSRRSSEFGEPYFLENEWGGPPRGEIVNLPRTNGQPAPLQQFVEPPVTAQPPVVVPAPVNGYERQDVVKAIPEFAPNQSLDEIAKDVQRYTLEQLLDDIAKDIQRYTYVIPREETPPEIHGFRSEQNLDTIVKDVPVFSRDIPHDGIAKTLQDFRPEQSLEEIAKDMQGFTAEQALAELTKDITPFEYVAVQPPPTDFNIVGTTERTPEPALYGIDPAYIIPGITNGERPAPTVTAVTPAAPAPSVNDPSFSIRTISALERGSYYVQLAAMPVDMVENTIRGFDSQFYSYAPGVYRESNNQYSIMIGPLNQGESAAVLARFRSIGYRSAVVRRGT